MYSVEFARGHSSTQGVGEIPQRSSARNLFMDKHISCTSCVSTQTGSEKGRAGGLEGVD